MSGTTVNEAGRKGALKRWKDHPTVRPYVGDLPPEVRRRIRDLIEEERRKLPASS